METAQKIMMLAEYSEANAYLDLFEAVPSTFAAEHGVKVAHLGSTPVVTVQSTPMILLNRALCLGLAEPMTEALLDSLIDYLKAAAGSNFALQISPTGDSPEVAGWLETRSMKPTNRWMKVYRDNTAPLPVESAFRIERIGRAEALIFVDTFSRAYPLPQFLHPWIALLVGRPGWIHYIAFAGDQPVGASALFVRQGTGWLGFGGTVPAFRRRGIQRAMITQRLHDGIDAGCRWFVSETDDHQPQRPNQSFLNLLNAGFRLAYARPNYEFRVTTSDETL